MPRLSVGGRVLLCAGLLAAPSSWTPTYELARARLLVTPVMSQPAYLQPVVEPVFGTQFVRITDPLMKAIGCRAVYCTHRYSSAQAWNADQSLLIIANGCEGLCFLDGQTYKLQFHRRMIDECEWHPIDPARMICVHGGTIYTWAPRTNAKTIVYESADYTNLQFGPYKGNPSNNGNRLVVRATNRGGTLVAFAYDILARRKFPDIDLSLLPGRNGSCRISPSGRYMICHQTLADEKEIAYVFTVEGTQIQCWTEHHRPAHGDMAVDADGSDVYVGISKADPDKYHVIKRRLVDGAVTDLAPYGEAQHASMRNIRRPGWVFLTYSGDYEELAAHPTWAPFYQEVIALRIDGSGELRRIVQTHDSRSGYWSEAHASPSPDGSQVVWSSNWEEPGGLVSDYVARLAWPDEVTR